MSGFLHSSQLPPGTYLPKTVNGKSRVDDKAARMAQDAKSERDCYRAVDARDGGRCRICGRQVSAIAVAMLDRAEHHHLVKRSKRHGHTTDNVVLLCVKRCHRDIHARAILRLSGNADFRNERGQLAGIKVERWTDAGSWITEGWR